MLVGMLLAFGACGKEEGDVADAASPYGRLPAHNALDPTLAQGAATRQVAGVHVWHILP